MDIDEAVTIANDEDVQNEVEINLRQERIRTALLTLPAAQRQVIILRYLEGWSIQEVALSLNRSAGAVKAIQHRATNSLRKYLTVQEESKMNTHENQSVPDAELQKDSPNSARYS